MKMLTIDLNLDAGESLEALTSGLEEGLYQCITSVNIACGGHTGDDVTMEMAVALAKKYGLTIGAHPSFPDKTHFGREILQLEGPVLIQSLVQQILALKTVCDRHAITLHHVKPHGALYNLGAYDFATTHALIEAVKRVDAKLRLVMLAGSASIDWIRQNGLKAVAEAFVDRRYENDGSLRSRKKSGALIEEPEVAAEQAFSLVSDSRVTAYDGSLVRVVPETLCIHGDTPNALKVAKSVREKLLSAGVILQSQD